MSIFEIFRNNYKTLRNFNGDKYYFIDGTNNLYFDSYKSGKLELIKNVDVKSFKLLTNFYSYDKYAFYHESKCIKSNYKTFRDYKKYGYLKVDDTLYWFGKKIKTGFKTDLINLSEHYFTDGKTLFVNGKMFDFDIKSFNVLSRFYAKDKNQVFHSDEVIKGADSYSFKVIKENSGYSTEILERFKFLNDNGYSSWGCDKDHLYFCGEIFLNGQILPPNIKVINDSILLDENHVYYLNKIINEADPNSFECIVDLRIKEEKNKIRFNTPFYKDSDNIYFFYEDYVKEENDHIIKCEKANLEHFQDDLKEILANQKFYNLNAKNINNINKILE